MYKFKNLWWLLSSINPETHNMTHYNQTVKGKDGKRFLKETREKQHTVFHCGSFDVYKGSPVKPSVDISSDTLQDKGSGRIYSKFSRGKKWEFCRQQNCASKMKEKWWHSQTNKSGSILLPLDSPYKKYNMRSLNLK